MRGRRDPESGAHVAWPTDVRGSPERAFGSLVVMRGARVWVDGPCGTKLSFFSPFFRVEGRSLSAALTTRPSFVNTTRESVHTSF